MKDKKQTNVKALDSAKYSGNVSVKVFHGKKAVKTLHTHNEGKQPLFEFLMYCLGGNYYGNKLPSYLRVFNSNSQEVTRAPISINGIPSYKNGTTSCSVIYSFIISPNNLNDYNDIQTFKIYSGEHSLDINSPSAEFSLDEPLNVSSSANLLVAWKLTISN